MLSLKRLALLVVVIVFGTAAFGQQQWQDYGTTGIYTGKDVGIGNATPAHKLDVGSTSARFGDGINSFNFHFNVPAANGAARFFVGGLERVTFAGNGRVGIGTNSPIRTFDVAGILAISNNNANYWDFNRDDTNGALTIGDSGTERFRIDSAGNVGIGTTTNTQYGKLKVAGSWSTTSPEYPWDSSVIGVRNTNVTDNTVQSILFTATNENNAESTVGAVSVAVTDHTAGTVDSDLYLGTTENNIYKTRLVIKNSGNVGIGGTPAAHYKLHVIGGNAHIDGTLTGRVVKAHYQDVAEWVPAAADLPAGTVVVLDPSHPNRVMSSSSAYDTTVAGVVSLQPGLILGEEGEDKEQVATTGRVTVKVDASRLPIRIGDLLVTSDRPGMAMRSVPKQLDGSPFHRPGTIIGKALEPLGGGEGEILVLLSMQ